MVITVLDHQNQIYPASTFDTINCLITVNEYNGFLQIAFYLIHLLPRCCQRLGNWDCSFLGEKTSGMMSDEVLLVLILNAE